MQILTKSFKMKVTSIFFTLFFTIIFLNTVFSQQTLRIENVQTKSGYNISYTVVLGQRKILANDKYSGACIGVDYQIKNLVIHSYHHFTLNKTFSGNDLAIQHHKYNGGISFPIRINNVNEATKSVSPSLKINFENTPHEFVSGGSGPLQHCPMTRIKNSEVFLSASLSPTHIKTGFYPTFKSTKFGVHLGTVISSLISEYLNHQNGKNSNSNTSTSKSSGVGNGINKNSNNTTNQETDAERRKRIDRESGEKIRQETQINIDRVNRNSDVVGNAAKNLIGGIISSTTKDSFKKMKEDEIRRKEIAAKKQNIYKQKQKILEEEMKEDANFDWAEAKTATFKSFTGLYLDELDKYVYLFPKLKVLFLTEYLDNSLPKSIEYLDNLVNIQIHQSPKYNHSFFIPKEFGNLKSLEGIWFTQTSLKKINFEKGSFKNLKHLNYVQFNSSKLLEIPDEIYSNPNVSKIVLRTNPFNHNRKLRKTTYSKLIGQLELIKAYTPITVLQCDANDNCTAIVKGKSKINQLNNN